MFKGLGRLSNKKIDWIMNDLDGCLWLNNK